MQETQQFAPSSGSICSNAFRIPELIGIAKPVRKSHRLCTCPAFFGMSSACPCDQVPLVFSGSPEIRSPGRHAKDRIQAFGRSLFHAPCLRHCPVTVSGGWVYNRMAKKGVPVGGKGFDKPLYDTGALYNDFDYEVKPRS